MCVIIDASVASLVFGQSPSPDFRPVIDWLVSPDRDGRLAYGGRLKRELFTVRGARRFILRLRGAGRATLFPDAAVDAKEKELKRGGLCLSNDQHIIALAIVSGARTLCSNNDKKRHLFADFKNKALIDHPRGGIYRGPSHWRLLRHTSSCERQLKHASSSA